MMQVKQNNTVNILWNYKNTGRKSKNLPVNFFVRRFFNMEEKNANNEAFDIESQNIEELRNYQEGGED